MGQCFSVGSKKGHISKIDRVVEYLHYGEQKLDIHGDFFVTNDTDELDYLVVLHPGAARVTNCTWHGWKQPGDPLTTLFIRLHKEKCSPSVENRYGCVKVGDLEYDAGPIGPEPYLFAGGYSETDDAPFTEFKIGPIVKGSFVVRVQFELGLVSYKAMINNGKPGIFGGDSLIRQIKEKQLPEEYRSELDKFTNGRRRSIDEYEVIIYDEVASRLPDVLYTSSGTNQPADYAARKANCLWFVAKGEQAGRFEIRIELKKG